MNIIFILISCSILLALIFLAAFFWATRTGQNDDLHTPAIRILLDDPVEICKDNLIKKGDEDHPS